MAARFWVGGTANWDTSTTTNWSATSGGGGGASVPTSSDDVTFDSLSNATAYTVTISATANCANLTVGQPLAGATTFKTSSQINIFGNTSFASGVLFSNAAGTIVFSATSGTKTITTNGVKISASTVNFNGSGGTFQLLDNLELSSGIVAFLAGTFDGNTHTFTLSRGVGLTFTVSVATTFYNLSIIPSAPSKNDNCVLSGDITVSNLFTISDGATATNRVFLSSSARGTSRTITAASVSIANADLQDITGAGAANWDLSAITGLSGDCGGNSGIIFTSPTTQTATGTASFTWSTHGWTTHVPLPQDTAMVSNAFVASRVVTFDTPRTGSIDFSSCSGSPTFTLANGATIFGYLDLRGVASLTGAFGMSFAGRGGGTINTNGLSILGASGTDCVGGTYTLAADFTCTSFLTFSSGTLDANNFNFTCLSLQFGSSLVATLIMGSGTWTLTGSGAFMWGNGANTNIVITPGTSTIHCTDTTNSAITIEGTSKTYNNIWFDRGASTGSITINGNNTFKDFRDTGTAAHSILFTAGKTQRVTTFTVSGSAVGSEITINSTTTGTHSLIKANMTPVHCDFLNIQHSVATPAANVWFAGDNSISNQNVATTGSGWIFYAADFGALANNLSKPLRPRAFGPGLAR